MENSQQPGEYKNLPQAYRTAYLIAGYIRESLTEAERDELDQWVSARKDNMRLFDELTEEHNLQKTLSWFEKLETEKALQEVKSRMQFRKRRLPGYWPYAIAASLLITTGLLLYVFYWKDREKTQKEYVQQDLLPADDRAILTLETGKEIALEEWNNGILPSVAKISGGHGVLSYAQTDELDELVYHTLTVPRKGHYKLVLPDGTMVWLNAESSITYPVSFAGSERRVMVSGETYFEIAKNADKPFIVEIGEMTVQAIGTAFNINAYDNEPAVSTTLIEGSVKIKNDKETILLKPGEQARIYDSEIVKERVETADVIAWKNNEFRFRNTAADAIMRQIERWYDAEVIYQDSVSFHLNASIERTVPVSKLLQLLEATGHIHFKIKGDQIIVMK